MADMTIKRHEMPHQEGSVRRHNFDEVATGYTAEMAIAEAKRCLDCKTKPCVTGCPVQIDIPSFMAEVALGNFEEAYQIILRQSSLPAVCGRVCPQETQCEAKCVRGIKGEAVAIGNVERFVADWHLENASGHLPEITKQNKKVAVIGSGPTGLTCAGDLAKYGYDVTIFEALHLPGGVLTYGIPEFRLPKAIVAKEIAALKKLGVEIERNTIIGKTLLIDELEDEGFEACFIGSGAGLPKFLDIPGENINAVYAANEYLTRINLMKAYVAGSETPIFQGEHVCVIGGGNVAMDAARCALRMGAETVKIVYRRTIEELPARKEEVKHAIEEGVIFEELCAPVEILADDKLYVKGMRCIKMELGEPDASGRRSPREIPGSEYTLETDCVIMALGTVPNTMITETTAALDVDKRGCIMIDAKGQTSIGNVFAGGDAVTGAATVIRAMGAGKLAAKSIHEMLSGQTQ